MSCRSRGWACAVRWMACRDVGVIDSKGLRVQQRFARFQAQERREGAEHGAQDHPNGDSELPKDGAAAPNRCAGHPNRCEGACGAGIGLRTFLTAVLNRCSLRGGLRFLHHLAAERQDAGFAFGIFGLGDLAELHIHLR